MKGLEIFALTGKIAVIIGGSVGLNYSSFSIILSVLLRGLDYDNKTGRGRL